MGVITDLDLDGTREFVIFDGVRDAGEFDTRLKAINVYTPTSADNDIAAVLDQVITDNPDLASNPLDPGNGNGYGDGIPSDDLDEVLVDDAVVENLHHIRNAIAYEEFTM